MDRSWLIFRLVMTLVLACGGAYLGWRISGGLASATARRAVWAVLGLFLLIQFLAPMLYRREDLDVTAMSAQLLLWAAFTALGFLAGAFFLTLLSEPLRGVLHLASGPDPERRKFLFGLLPWGIVGGASLMSGLGLLESRQPKLKEVRVPVKGLHPGLVGFRIVQLTDVHVGQTIGREFVERAVAVANEAGADLVALTGDMVDGHIPAIGGWVEPLGGLKARHGVVYIPGNHEYYWGLEPWLKQFEKLGARVLGNTHHLIEHGGAKLLVAGIFDHGAKRMGHPKAPDAQAAMKGAPSRDFLLFLSHQPKGIYEGESIGADLQLSGHTHAGQFFPVSLFNRFFHPYWRGLNRHAGKMWIYVSNGTGYWGPPNRFAVPPEVTLLILERDEGGHPAARDSKDTA